MDNKSMMRCKNMFALGMVYWMLSKPLDNTIEFLNRKFKNKQLIIDANIKPSKQVIILQRPLKLCLQPILFYLQILKKVLIEALLEIKQLHGDS